VQQVKVHSTFSRPMEVTHIAPINKDDRIKYIPLEEATMPIISKGENNVGSIQIDPSVTCKQQCYLGLSLDTNSKQYIIYLYFFLLFVNLEYTGRIIMITIVISVISVRIATFYFYSR